MLHDRGLKNHSLGLPLLPPRKISSPASYGLRVTTGWEVILQRQWPLGPRAQRGLAHSQGTSRQPPHGCSITFALQEKAPRLRPVFTMPGSCRENTLGAYLDPRPRAPNWHFSHGEPFVGQPSNCLQRSPVAVCFLLPELALLPTLAFGKPVPPLAGGPWDVPGALGQVNPAWHPASSDALSLSPSPWAGPS